MHLTDGLPDRAAARSRRLFRPIVPVDDPLPARLGSPFRPYLRLLLYAVLVLALMPVQMVCLAVGWRRAAERLPLFFHRTCLRVVGIRVEQRGAPAPVRPTLFVCNHSSYLDVVVLGALLPGSFVAKAEVAGWPLFGLLAKLQRTVFVDRRRNSAQRQRDSIARRLAAGDNLILFPEGTSNDGNRTLPFRSALLSAAETPTQPGGAPVTVQPVSVAYTLLNGMPIGHALRPLVAWYGDMALAEHLWHFLRLGKLTAVVCFHPPVTIADFASRKALADHCHDAIAEGITEALAGRPWPAPAVPETAAASEAAPAHPESLPPTAGDAAEAPARAPAPTPG